MTCNMTLKKLQVGPSLHIVYFTLFSYIEQREKKQSFTMSLKCEAIEYAERESNQAARVKHIRKWHKNKVSWSKIWKMTTAQKEPHCLIDKLLLYILQVFRLSKQHKNQPACIIAMDEMLVWDDMVSNKTFERVGATSISLKMTGYEKVMV